MQMILCYNISSTHKQESNLNSTFWILHGDVCFLQSHDDDVELNIDHVSYRIHDYSRFIASLNVKPFGETGL